MDSSPFPYLCPTAKEPVRSELMDRHNLYLKAIPYNKDTYIEAT